ncbi:hypothetical protein HPG69_004313 [Diceros bicornis minor]|uniref:Uncharacterized protein n=1 Tax=Diceros bicornis minor TaxID=77932 RepID=A0A7J7EGV6_DICBM|nr:hypothetical protein HPG69_004313 [Diceros bicornis minor]
MAVPLTSAPAVPRPLTAAILFPQSDLLDVNQIIKDLSSVVSEQGDAIGRYPATCSFPQVSPNSSRRPRQGRLV